MHAAGLKANGAQAPAAKFVVGPAELAEFYGRSAQWARDTLRLWWREQQEGGEVRVFRRPWPGKPNAFVYYTTVATLQRIMPPARDVALVRKCEELERDLEVACRRLDDALRRLEHLEKLLRIRRPA